MKTNKQCFDCGMKLKKDYTDKNLTLTIDNEKFRFCNNCAELIKERYFKNKNK